MRTLQGVVQRVVQAAEARQVEAGAALAREVLEGAPATDAAAQRTPVQRSGRVRGQRAPQPREDWSGTGPNRPTACMEELR